MMAQRQARNHLAPLLCLALALGWVAEPPQARAQQAGDGDDEDQALTETRAQAAEVAMERQLDGDQGALHLFQILEEISDDLITDLRQLQGEVVSPLAMRRLQLTSNLDRDVGRLAEAYLRAAITNHTEIDLKRCIACDALRSRVERGTWVTTLGLVEHEQMVREAERLGVVAFLDTRLAYFPNANLVALQVEILRAEDGAILWSETYRSDATTAAALRTGERVEVRQDRVEELERKLAEDPVYGHVLMVGGAQIPYDSPDGNLAGPLAGYRFVEQFGEDQRWLYGLEIAVMMSTQITAGLFVQALMQYQLNAPNLNDPLLRTGPSGGAFILFGNEGSSGLVEWTFDAIFQFRLGAGASLFYYLPTTFAGADLGGLGFKGRVTFNW